ncbi:MAG: tetratricopeptide repeat protein [Thiobacillus sp.]|nr:tetratricopeptide repeat protein [Thiobacillus sp.]
MLLRTFKSILFPATETIKESIPDQVRRLIREKRAQEAHALLLPLLGKAGQAPEVMALIGEVEYHLKHIAEAEDLFMKALREKPGLAMAHYGLSLTYYESGRYFDALAQAQYACNLSQRTARYLAQLGLCQIATKSYGPARDTLRQAVLLDPENVPALNNFAIALQVLGDTDDALRHIRRALELDPDYEPAQQNLALFAAPPDYSTHFDAEAGVIELHPHAHDRPPSYGLSSDDISRLESQFSAHPDDVDLASRLIQAHMNALRVEDARDILRIALAHHHEHVDLLVLKAKIASQLGQLRLARDIYERVVARSPDHVEALLGLGQVLRDLGKVNDAVAPTERAAALSDKPETLIQLAFTYSNACRYPECLATCDRVEAQAPSVAPFLLSSRAVSHAYLGNFDEAMKLVHQAQQHEATSAGFQVFLGMLQLQNEDYAAGWEGYRHRALLDAEHQRLLPYPHWQGEDPAGKTILILAEQGLGDQVMFTSCLPDLLALHPKRVLLEAHERVERTLARSFPEIQVFASGQKNFDWLPAGLEPDYYLPIADLPYYFRRNREAFPKHRGYLSADRERVAYWRERLGTGRPAIGFTWRGGLQRTRQAIRSLALDQLAPLLCDPHARFVNLQYGDVAEEISAFAGKQGLDILNFPEAMADLDEFAALICALDMVITVCNTTVHYAGALGKPCWVLTPHVPEWRYGLTSPSMPWYPSTRMFRQPMPGDWDAVLQQVQVALSAWLQCPRNEA